MHREVEVLIIGTGFSGLGMAIELKRTGRHDFVVLEKADDVGGTWRDNTYPGCACDVPSHLYSFSFEPNPGWSRLFAPQAEIWDYLRAGAPTSTACARTSGSAPRSTARAGTTTSSAGTSRTEDGDDVHREVRRRRRRRAAHPERPGPARASRTSAARRSTRPSWDHDYDLTRQAGRGRSAPARSAIQFVPQIADQVGRAARLPAHAAVGHARSPTARSARPGAGCSARCRRSRSGCTATGIYWALESRALGFAVQPEDHGAGAEASRKRHMRSQVADPALRREADARLPMGCKRILISQRLLPGADQAQRGRGHRRHRRGARERRSSTSDGVEHEVDAIIFGTGFHVDRLVRRPGHHRARAASTWRSTGASRASRPTRHHRRRASRTCSSCSARTPASGTTRWCS